MQMIYLKNGLIKVTRRSISNNKHNFQSSDVNVDYFPAISYSLQMQIPLVAHLHFYQPHNAKKNAKELPSKCTTKQTRKTTNKRRAADNEQFCKSWGKVQNSTFVLLFSSSAKFNFSASISQPSQSCKNVMCNLGRPTVLT